MTAAIAGGIGLFLLGMVLLTDGLKALAGDALRLVLSRFVSGPWSAMASGAAATLLVQSSTATTLTTIGFVSAGLITFQESVGVIFGANLGTTSTGWLVSLLGLRFSIGAVAFPTVAVGALLRLLGRDRVAAAGLTIAGFGLLFVGIDTLQAGMAGLADRIDLSGIGGEGVWDRLLLVLAGVVLTVIVQSSSVAVATTMTALHAGALSLPQAAALVIGENIGTTLTAALAAIGASIAAKRTALVHILFNVLTAVVAFALVPAFVAVAALAGAMADPDAATLAIAAFHTGFKVLGILVLAPWLSGFSRLVERIVPERGPDLTRRLDPSVAKLAPVAVEAARLTLLDVARALAGALHDALSTGPTPRTRGIVVAAARALDETRAFLARIRTDAESASEHERHIAVLSAHDHLRRLVRRAVDRPDAIAAARELDAVGTPREWLLGLLAEVRDRLDANEAETLLPRLAKISRSLASTRRAMRDRILHETAHGRLSAAEASRQIDAINWMDRVGYHLWHAGARLCLRRAREFEPGGTAEAAPRT